MKPAYIMAAVILAVTAAVTLFTFAGAVAQHSSITQAMAHPGATLQVPGKIIKDSVQYDATKGELRFDVIEVSRGADKKEIVGDKRMTIIYRQPKPENFDTAVGVEAVGKFENGVFKADNLLVKCPSKYNDQPKQAPAVRGK